MKRNTKRQGGYIYPRAGWWVLRYRDDVLEGGELIRKQLAKQLAQIKPEHARLKRPPADVEDMAEAFLRPLNSGETNPQSTQSIGQFVENYFFPRLEHEIRECTLAGYRGRWRSQLKPRCENETLRAFNVLAAQGVLDSIHRQNPEMTRSTLVHLRNLLSLVFDDAERLGLLDKSQGNPVRLVRIPKRAPKGKDTYAYSLRELETILAVLPEPAATICAVGGYAGLRRSEIRGLRWEDYDGQRISINRSIWEGFISEPKSEKSKAAVPVIPRLRTMLEAHRLACGNPKTGPMFANSAGKPENLNNVLNRAILPALNRCRVCRKPKAEHVLAHVSHEFLRDDNLPTWHGFHAFRRGLATSLYDLGVDDFMIQQILRQAHVETTRRHYIKPLPTQSVAAMAKLEAGLPELCADRALVQMPAANKLPA
jgi:integrase